MASSLQNDVAARRRAVTFAQLRGSPPTNPSASWGDGAAAAGGAAAPRGAGRSPPRPPHLLCSSRCRKTRKDGEGVLGKVTPRRGSPRLPEPQGKSQMVNDFETSASAGSGAAGR